jgi:dipeptidyl aminopeptidase/acylaminoacyl peptidase
MRRLVLAVSILTGLLPAWSVPPPVLAAGDSPSRPTIQEFLKIRTPGAPAILPDGSLLLRDWPDGVRQLYRIVPKSEAAQGPSYRPGDVTTLRLTDFADGLAGFTLSPDGRKVILSHARGGDENTQLTLLDPLAEPGKGLTPLYSNPKVQTSANVWLHDGSGFIYSANDESPNDFYLYRYDFATGRATRLLGEAGSWSANGITDDGKRMLVEKHVSASDVQCFELDLATGKRKDLTIRPQGGTAACTVTGYMPGERAVLMRSDLKDGMQRLYLKDLQSGAVREPIPALGCFELDAAGPNDSREFLFALTNQEGCGVLSVYTLPGFEPVPMPQTDQGVVSAASFRGSTLVWTLSNARTAGLAYATTFTRARRGAVAQTTRQLTWTQDQGIDLKSFPLPELVKYAAFDGRQIPAFLCLPPGYVKGTAIPFIVNYHGGPEGQHRPGFSATDQYLLSRGFGILLPNVRGSTGYGRAFQMLDDYKGRWGSVRDGVDAAEWLVRNGYAAAGRIATYGGSYGGFMSVACLIEDQERVERGERPERLFGACVDIVGIVNLETFLQKTSGYRRKLREMEYGPLTDPEFLASISSIHRVDEIQVPVFIAHGFNDPRVPVQEAMQLATALKERGRGPRMFVAPDEGHGFVKLDNRIYFNERMAQFLEETIGSGRDAAK